MAQLDAEDVLGPFLQYGAQLREHIPKQAVLGGLRVVVVHQPVDSGVPLRIEVLQRLGGGGLGCDADVDVAVGHEVLVAAAEDILQVIAGGGIQDIHIDIPGKLFRIFRVMDQQAGGIIHVRSLDDRHVGPLVRQAIYVGLARHEELHLAKAILLGQLVDVAHGAVHGAEGMAAHRFAVLVVGRALIRDVYELKAIGFRNRGDGLLNRRSVRAGLACVAVSLVPAVVGDVFAHCDLSLFALLTGLVIECAVLAAAVLGEEVVPDGLALFLKVDMRRILYLGKLDQRHVVVIGKGAGDKSVVVLLAGAHLSFVGAVLLVPSLKRLDGRAAFHQGGIPGGVVLAQEGPGGQHGTGLNPVHRRRHIAHGGDGGKTVGKLGAHGPGHQAAVGMAGGVDAAGVNAVFLLQLIQQGVKELQIRIFVHTRAGQSGKGTRKPHGGGDVAHHISRSDQALGKDHDKAVLLGHVVPAGLLGDGVHGGGIAVHHQYQGHLGFAGIGGGHIGHPAADFAVHFLLVNGKARLGKVLGLGHTAGKLHGHKALIGPQELIPDGLGGLSLGADPNLRIGALPARNIDLTGIRVSRAGRSLGGGHIVV